MTDRRGRPRILLISASHFEPDGRVARVERYWTSALTLVHLEALTPPAPRNISIQMHYLTANLIFRKMQRAGRHPYLY